MENQIEILQDIGKIKKIVSPSSQDTVAVAIWLDGLTKLLATDKIS